MNTITIDKHVYVIPQLGFKQYAQMERASDGSLIEAFRKKQFFVLAEAFVAVVANCSADKAAEIVESHVEGGGDLTDIVEAFASAIDESTFFKKMLKSDQETQEKTQETSSAVEIKKK